MVQQYHGNYVTAESASNYIDINAIALGCKNLAANSEEFNYISEKIYSAGDICNGEALSIDGDTLTDYIYEQGNMVGKISSTITSLADDIINRAYEAYNSLQSQLNDKAYREESDYVNELNKKNNS